MAAIQRSFQPSGVITLTTDFGLQDPYVGTMKGVIACAARGLDVIDLTHEVPPFRPEIAGLWIGRCHRWFANGTVHVAVVDPGVGTARPIVCLETPDHVFLAPDNGLAGELTRHLDRWQSTTVDTCVLGLDVPSTTFHGRDIFAPVAALLAAGRIGPADLGPAAQEIEASALPRARSEEHRIDGEVLFADRFGNLCTNIPGPVPADWNRAEVIAGNSTLRLVRAYDEAGHGELIGIFNSFGLLEIALPRGSAARMESWCAGTPVSLRRIP